MGFILLLILLTVIISAFTYIVCDDSDRSTYAITAAFICTMIFGIIVLATWGASYSTHIGLKQRLVTIEQYKETINLYAEKGVAEFQSPGGSSTELTDLKYNNYQNKMAYMITDLRYEIVKYNENLISKKVLKASWFWNWCVFLDEDLKTIQMVDQMK